MKEIFKQTFDPMVAPQDLVAKTKSRVLTQMEKPQVKNRWMTRFVIGLTTLIVLMGGGYWMYFIPVVTISVDINPSIELSINRLDRVISVKAYNDDGQTIIETMDLTNDTYTQALNELLADSTITALLADNGQVNITVVGNDHDHCLNMIETINNDVSCSGHMSCHHGNTSELEQAHDHGLSYGKYAMYQRLLEYYPDLTIEQVQDMSMRELMDLLDVVEPDSDITVPSNGYGHDHGHHGWSNHE